MSESERQLIIDASTIQPHLCCTNPYWLYKIYQDTDVTLSEVIEIIREGLDASSKHLQSLVGINENSVPLMEPLIGTITCMSDPGRTPGSLWASWKFPWTGIQVLKWEIFVITTGHTYMSNTNATSIAIPGFNAGQSVSFKVRSIGEESHGVWKMGHCVV